MTNGLLINYAGVPQEMSSLFPDNGLALLAAILQQEKQGVTIFDFSTTATIHAVYNAGLGKALGKIAPIIYGKGKIDQAGLVQLGNMDEEIQAREEKFIGDSIAFLNRHVNTHGIGWIGFKLWMGTIRQSMALARGLKKEHPHLKVFSGGPGVDIFKETILKKYPFVDALVFAEAEHALPLLVKWVEGREQLCRIPNLIYRENGVIKKTEIERVTALDELPYPVYDPEVYPAMQGDGKMKILCLDDSRGCPMGCAFCPGTNKFGRKRLEKSSGRCFAELSHLKAAYGVRYFRFSGSNTSVRLLSEIADRLIETDTAITFAVFSSTEGLTAELVAKLVRAGLHSVFVGIESADPFQLKTYLGKTQSLERLREIFMACKHAGVFITASMIHPAPFSSQAVFDQNLGYLLNNFKGYDNCSVSLFPAGLYPHTQWFDHMDEYGFSLTDCTPEEYMETLLDYRYNLVLPRYLWKDLPYRLNGKPFKQLLLETNELATRIQSHGILPYLMEANLIPAHALGYTDYKIFGHDSNVAFFRGDAERLEQWNHTFNQRQTENQ